MATATATATATPTEEVDILLTGVTGFVGRYILHEIVERHPEKRIAVIIRSSGKTSAPQRWADEIVGASLFGRWEAPLRKVRVIDAALEQLESTTHHLAKAGCIIHCAANIKHYDPYEALERDNVGNVERILRLAESLHTQHLILLSTCYVHPRHAIAKRDPICITGGPKQSDFYNDYCYTKWRGEEAIFAAKTRIPNITIARLSCVGAPSRWDLAAHPCAAQAHLGVVSLALRGFLEVLAWRPQARISVVPVDLVAKGIVDHMLEVKDKDNDTTGIQILQLCPPPELTAYHISLPLVISILQTEYGLENFRGLARDDSRGLHLAWWKQVAYSCLSRGQKAITLHSHVQDFVSTFTDTDIRFGSSLASSEFPTRSEYDIVRETCAYAVRILHHRELAKGLPMTTMDRFWSRMANREPVQVCIRLGLGLGLGGEGGVGGGEGVGISEWPAFAQRMCNVFLQHRKCAAGLSNESWHPVSGHSLATYFASPQPHIGKDAADAATASILSYGLQQAAPDRPWSVTPFLNAAGTHISHILLRFDHGLMDGAGMLSYLPDFSRRVLEEEVPERGDTKPVRTLGLWMDLWMGLVYLVLLAVMVWTAPTFNDDTRSKEPTVATGSTGFVGPPSGRTYTTELLWKLTQHFATVHRQPEHIFAVPAITTSFRPAKDMPTNAIVPVLLPLDARMSEEAFAHRCMLLRSRSVRFLSWCILQLIEWGGWNEIRDLFLGKVRCVVSSLQAGSALPTGIVSAHIVTTTPTPIPYSVTVLTGRKMAFYTVRSHDSRLSATDILDILCAGEKIEETS